MKDDHYLLVAFGLFAGICSIASFVLGVCDVIGFGQAISGTVLFFVIFLIVGRSFALRAPVFCVRTTVDVEIEDRSGKTVKSEKTQRFIPLRRSITRFEETITTDGTISSVEADLQSEVSSLRQGSQSPGLQVWHHDFDRELRPFRRYVRKLTVSYQDAFTSDREYYDTVINYPGKDLFVRIRFPVDRPPHQVRCIETVGAVVLSRGELNLQKWQGSNQLFVEWHIKWPIIGHKCTIEWEW